MPVVNWQRYCSTCHPAFAITDPHACVHVCLQDAWLRGAAIEGYPHYAVQHKTAGQSVIGSQPVSLDRENLELLRRKRYVHLCCCMLQRAFGRQLQQQAHDAVITLCAALGPFCS